MAKTTTKAKTYKPLNLQGTQPMTPPPLVIPPQPSVKVGDMTIPLNPNANKTVSVGGSNKVFDIASGNIIDKPAPIAGGIDPNKDQPTQSGLSEVYRNEQGRLSGITTPDGSTFLGLSPQDVQFISQQEAAKKATPEGAIEVSQARAQEQTVALQNEAAQRVSVNTQQQLQGSPDMQTNPTAQGTAGIQQGTSNVIASPIDFNQVARYALADPSSIKNIATFALGAGFAGSMVAGASAGAVAGPAGIAVGAAIGLVIGVYSSIRTNINQQKSEDLTSQYSVLRDGKVNLQKVDALIKIDPSNVQKYLDLRDEQLARISQAYSQMKLDTHGNLNLALGQDGTNYLQKYKNFYAEGGYLEVANQKLMTSLGAQNAQQGLTELMMIEQGVGAGD